MRFEDRREAGRYLAGKLREYAGECVVYALPRGGVETGVEVAKLLDAPLELIIARKIGHPDSPEYAIGAVTESGPPVLNEAEVSTVNKAWLAQAEKTARREAKRRRKAYMLDRWKLIGAENKVAIIVDDGMATGLTMKAAAAEVRKLRPKKLIAAVPCASRRAVDELLEEVDEIIVLESPDTFLGAIGFYYTYFPQLSDEDVVDLLDEAGG